MTGPAVTGRGKLSVGERVLLLDSKNRRYLVTLKVGGEFHTHSGPLPLDEMIGQDEGVVVRSPRGAKYTVVRPTMAEAILEMPRGAQVIYPKDIGAILMLADIFPGCRVLEAGLGSGALSMAMLRAGADIIGYEIRDDHAKKAVANVVAQLGEDILSRYSVNELDVYQGIAARDLDRVVLDLPEPWRVLPHAAKALRPGGILLSYLPTVPQVMTLRSDMDKAGFGMAQTLEVLHRGWNIDGMSVRPDHRMVAHTGFLTVARLVRPSSDLTLEDEVLASDD